jgi:hypothetical protein
MEENKKIKWHPGFYAGIEYDLRKYRNELEFKREYLLSKEPTKMDLLVIKKRSNVIIDNAVGKIFRKYNVIEYKSPDDELSVDELYKTIGYACLYKGYGQFVDEISASELTVSIFRHTHPYKLMENLVDMGAKVESKLSGVYYVSGVINLPLQIIVVRELDDEAFNALRILTHGADETDVKRFILESRSVNIPADKHNIDAVLQVSVSANDELYEKIRRENTMCEALRELMKDEIDREVEEAVEKAERDTRIKTRYEDGMPLDEIASRSNVSIEIVNQVLKEKGMIE